MAYSVAADGDCVWVGTRRHGLLRLKDGAFTHADIDRNGLHTNILYDVSCADKVWLSIYNLGMLCFDGSNWTKYDSENSPLPCNYISGIQVDSHNKVWMNNLKVINTPVSGGGYGGGLIGFDGTNWDIYNRHNSGIANPWPIQVRIDSARDRVWLAHEASGGISSATINVYGGVDTTSAPTAGVKAYYTLDGLRVTTPRPGRLYIVRDADGRVTKRVFRQSDS